MLTRRFAWLVEQDTPAECILALTSSQPGRGGAARAARGCCSTRPTRSCTFHLPLVLRAAAPGRGPRGRRRPVLLAGHPGRPARAAARPHRRADAAPPRDPRQPRPAAGQLRVAHRPAQGGDGVGARATGLRRGPAGRPRRRRARAGRREREFARLYADHDRLLGERGALDYGDLVLRAFRLLHEKPHVRERAARRFRHVLVDDFQDANFAQGMLLQLLVDEHRKVTIASADDQAITRAPSRTPRSLRSNATSARGRRILAGRPGRAGTPGAQGRRRERRPRALLALPLRARAGPGGGRRGGAADRGRGGGRGDLRARALGPGRGSHRGLRARGACGGVPHLRRRRLLPARRGARRARLAARAGRPGGLRRGGARAQPRRRSSCEPVDVARLTQLARRRKLDMPAAVAAALEGPQLSEEGRDRARAFLRLYRSASAAFDERRPDAFVHAPDRAHRAAPPAGVRHPRRHRRAAAQHRQAARAGHGATCSASRRPRRATSPATWPPWPSPGCARRRRWASRPRRRCSIMTMRRSARARVRARLRARALGGRACPAPSARATAGVPDALRAERPRARPRGPRGARCAACCTWP